MNIQIDPHTLERAEERGANANEIRDVLENGQALPARRGRKSKARAYVYEQERNGKWYPHKRVEVIYTEDIDVVVTVTVYVFYGSWESGDAYPLQP